MENDHQTAGGEYVFVPYGSTVETPEQKKERELYWRIQHEEYERRLTIIQRRQYEMKAHRGALGYFYFIASDKEYHVSAAAFARLLYLCTFLEKMDDPTLYKTKRTLMRLVDLESVLGLSRNTVKDFLKEVGDFLMITEEGHIAVNNDFCRRGHIEEKTGKRFQRAYRDTIRDLYERTPVNKHRYLGYIYLMLEYINIEYNILCWNAGERDLSKIRPLSVADFCEAIGIDVGHISRIKKEYAKLTFDVDGRLEYFCQFTSNGEPNGAERIFVNPHIIYSGHDYKRVEVLGALCAKDEVAVNWTEGNPEDKTSMIDEYFDRIIYDSET